MRTGVTEEVGGGTTVCFAGLVPATINKNSFETSQLKILKFVNFLFNFFPPQKVAKSASTKTILNSTNYVIHV